MEYIENLNGYDYQLIFTYVIGFSIVIGSTILRQLQNNNTIFLRNDRNLLIVFCAFIILFSGTRSIHIGTDTWNYYHYFYLRGLPFLNDIIAFFKYLQTDFLFEVIMYLSFHFKSFTIFLLVVSLVINVSMFKYVRKFTDNGRLGSSLMLFLLFAGNMITFTAHQLNTIRNGVAIPFILFGIYYLNIKNYKKGVFYFIIAYLAHSTSLLPIACTFIALIAEKVKYKYFIYFYILGIALAFLGFGFDKLSFLTELQGDNFQKLSFVGDTNYRIGFRIDFVVYNSFFLFLFLKFSNLKDSTNLLLIKYYILASVVFFWNFNVPFSDRVGAYSWVVIPLMLFNMVKTSSSNRKLDVLSFVTLGYFIINYIILPFLSGGYEPNDPN